MRFDENVQAGASESEVLTNSESKLQTVNRSPSVTYLLKFEIKNEKCPEKVLIGGSKHAAVQPHRAAGH